MGSDEVDILSFVAGVFRYDRILMAILGLLAITIAVKVLSRISKELQGAWPAQRLRILQVATITNFAIYIGGGLVVIYAAFSPPREVLLAIGGSAAVAVGFSLKDVVSSVVSGVILLFDRPFKVGDRVRFGENYGEIIGIGLRTTKLLTLDSTLVTIPNARFLADVVTCANSGSPDMLVVVRFFLPLGADLDRIREIVNEVIVTSRYSYLKKPVGILVREEVFDGRVIMVLTSKSYVLDCRFEKAYETDITVRVAAALRKHNLRSTPSEEDNTTSKQAPLLEKPRKKGSKEQAIDSSCQPVGSGVLGAICRHGLGTAPFALETARASFRIDRCCKGKRSAGGNIAFECFDCSGIHRMRLYFFPPPC